MECGKNAIDVQRITTGCFIWSVEIKQINEAGKKRIESRTNLAYHAKEFAFYSVDDSRQLISYKEQH